MSEAVKHWVRLVGEAVDVLGIVVIVCGILLVAWRATLRWKTSDQSELYQRSRHGIGRSILLGLEILVAGDIIRTVAIEPTFGSVGVLAAIVLVRTFLSWSLEIELNHRLPWRREGPS